MSLAYSVYLLCALTSSVCAGLLYRAFLRNTAGILFWSALCFVGLAFNNWLLFLGPVLCPDRDLGLLRAIPAVAGLAALVYGLIWEVR